MLTRVNSCNNMDVDTGVSDGDVLDLGTLTLVEELVEKAGNNMKNSSQSRMDRSNFDWKQI